jgi:hypothetical protein
MRVQVSFKLKIAYARIFIRTEFKSIVSVEFARKTNWFVEKNIQSVAQVLTFLIPSVEYWKSDIE